MKEQEPLYVVRIQLGLKHKYYQRTFRRSLIYTKFSQFAAKLTEDEAKAIAKAAKEENKRILTFIESIN